jgi:hypothetical protein
MIDLTPPVTTTGLELEDDMAKAKKSKKAPQVVNGSAGKYGRIGTAAELYKRLIMEHGMNNEQAHAEVESQLGKKAAGGANYPGWYRTWLNGHGFEAPPSKPFKK